MTGVSDIKAREVLDSRGNPTVEVDVLCSDGSRGRAIVPSGASTGSAEAHELRDVDQQRFGGRGVSRAVAHVNEIIAPRILGRDPADQFEIDRLLRDLDGSKQKSKLGANAVLGVSLASAHAAAAAAGLPLYRHLARLLQELPTTAGPNPFEINEPQLPLPMTNMISGGLHAGGNLDFQDFMIIPEGAPNYTTGLEWIVRVYRRLGKLLAETGYSPQLVADEGGYGPRLSGNREALQLIVRAIETAGLTTSSDVTVAIDVAATHFYDGRQYRLSAAQESALSCDELIDGLTALSEEFPITSIEDGLAEEDWTGWQKLTQRLGGRLQIVGDDLLTTDPDRLRKAIELRAANAVLIKVNQIGTLSETFEVMQLARAAGFRLIVSARSGETEDTTIADLAVAASAEHIKIGSITRGERLAKYNRLIRIAEELDRDATGS